MDKLLSAASGERIRYLNISYKDGETSVTVKDNNTDILDRCRSSKSEEEWEADKGWINKWNYQAFGIDKYKNKKTEEFISVYQSDYNKFYVLVETSPKMNRPINDSVMIAIWEGMFWPGPYNMTHESLREAVGEVAISIELIEGCDNTNFTMYTDKYILSAQIPWERIQFVFSVVLTKLYDCYIPEINSMFPEYETVFKSIMID